MPLGGLTKAVWEGGRETELEEGEKEGGMRGACSPDMYERRVPNLGYKKSLKEGARWYFPLAVQLDTG